MKLLIKYGANVNDTTYVSSSADDKLQGKEKIKYLVVSASLNFSLTGTSSFVGVCLPDLRMVLFLLVTRSESWQVRI